MLFVTKSITEPWFGEDVFRLCGVRFDLLSKMRDENSQVVGLIAVVRAPNGLKEFAMRYRFSGVRNEIAQQIKLFRSEANGFVSGSNLAGFEIDFKIS